MKSLVYGLRFNNIQGDIYGGLTAAVVALPLALAFGVSSGAGPIAGIYGAIFVGLFAALFGGTPAQVSGPTGPMTVVMASIFTQYTTMFPDDPVKGAGLAFTVVMLGGVFQIVLGLLKFGRYINLIPHPVISGFMSGIGVIIILLQLGPLLGHPALPGPVAAARSIPHLIATPVPNAVILGAITVAIVYLMPHRVNRILPSPLFALIACTVGLYVVSSGMITTVMVDGSNVQQMAGATILGDIPTAIPVPQLPAFEFGLLATMIKSAAMLAVLGAIDSLLTSLVADNITRTYHESNRELIGQGIGNAVAGIFGGLPGAGATMRTVVNVRAGGRTPISGALHALVLLTIVLGAGKFARYIPHAVLAGILVKVGTDIIDWDYLKRIRNTPVASISIMLVVFFITVFVDLITAVAVGMIMASLILLQRVSNLQLSSITAITEPTPESPLSEEEKQLLKEAGGRVLLFHLGGPMSFGAAKGMARRMAAFDHYDALVLDLTDVPHIDSTSALAVDDMIHDAVDRGRHAYLVGARPDVNKMLTRQGALRFIPEDHRFRERRSALQQGLRIVNERRSAPAA